MHWKATSIPLKDAFLLYRPKYHDFRGAFSELFKCSVLKQVGLNTHILQVNYSTSRRGVLRGLHMQIPPYAQGKLVTCVLGKVYDVIVDARPDSSTCGKWYAAELSETNCNVLWVPEGFLHGFLTLSDRAMVVYAVTGNEYVPESERTVKWNDRDLNIKWPLNAVAGVILSDKDMHGISFAELINELRTVVGRKNE